MSDVGGPQRGEFRTTGWRRVTRGIYTRQAEGQGEEGRQQELQAWQLALPPGGAFTHLTAAVLHGWWQPPLPADLPVFATVPHAGSRPRRPGLQVSRHRRPPGIARWNGLRATSPADTLLACARDLHLLDLTVLVDSALHLGQCTREELAAATAPSGRRTGAPRLRQALVLADARSESPWESLLRVLHQVCGVEVEPQRVLRDDDDAFVARADLWLVGTQTIHEYDGGHHRDLRQHRADLARERRLANIGWTRRGYTSVDVLHRPTAILRDADRALGRPTRPERVLAWHHLLGASLFTPQGTRVLRRRWGLPDT